MRALAVLVFFATVAQLAVAGRSAEPLPEPVTSMMGP